MANPAPTVVVHGFGTYAILYRHMIELAQREAPQITWAMILPTPHHHAAVREVLPESHILCLEREQARNFPVLKDLSELSAYGGNLYADIEVEKRVFKHRHGPEQVTRAVEIYRIYKRFLQRIGATHLLMSHIETLDGKLLVSLAAELGIRPCLPTDCRNLGGIFFSADVGETLPEYRRFDPALVPAARQFLADYRANPTPAINVKAEGLAGEQPLPLRRRPLLVRVFSIARRLARNPRLLEPGLLAISFRNNFPQLRDSVRAMRGLYNARQFDIEDTAALPGKFVYYPLQVTPESSINTPAPYYLDQTRAIDAIRFAMPSDHTLVVKEHPAFIGVRPWSFYRALRRKAGVQVAHYRLPSLELIRRAGMTISVTGTATFEAFLLGRPSLVLGSSFIADYLGGVCAIRDLPERIRAGLDRHVPDDAIVRALAEIMSVRHECLFRPPDEEGELSTRPSNVRRLLRAFLDHIDRVAKSAAVAPLTSGAVARGE